MSQSKYQQVTMIDDLPNLDEIEATNPQYQKFIRNNHVLPLESGMLAQQQYQEQYQQIENIKPKIIENYKGELNCIDVANHIKNCPICSQIYNTDKTGYIILISILIIICFLLLKKVLEM